jgi:hypothetical protein
LEPLDKRERDASTGFEAGYFQRGTDIVIAYAGTDPADLLGDIAADIGLATGLGSAQLLQAAENWNLGSGLVFTHCSSCDRYAGLLRRWIRV